MLNMNYAALSVNTPAYYFNVEDIKERVSLIREKLSSNIELCFAMKANPFLVSVMDSFVDHLEVCSPGEYEICTRNNILPGKIIVSGVNKTVDSVTKIMEYSKGCGTYTIESMLHFELLSKAAAKLGKKIDVIIRLSSGNQFGVDKDEFLSIADKVMEADYLNLIGLHYYSGTQKKFKKISSELLMLEEFGVMLKERYKLEHFLLEYGPGLIVSYFENDSEKDKEQANPCRQLEELNVELSKMSAYDHITI